MDTQRIGHQLEALFEATYDLDDAPRPESFKESKERFNAMLTAHEGVLSELSGHPDKRVAYRIDHIRTAQSTEIVRDKLQEIGAKLGIL